MRSKLFYISLIVGLFILLGGNAMGGLPYILFAGLMYGDNRGYLQGGLGVAVVMFILNIVYTYIDLWGLVDVGLWAYFSITAYNLLQD